MYDVYGIVKVEKYSCNKGEYFVPISHVISPQSKGTWRQVLCIAVYLISNT